MASGSDRLRHISSSKEKELDKLMILKMMWKCVCINLRGSEKGDENKALQGLILGIRTPFLLARCLLWEITFLK